MPSTTDMPRTGLSTPINIATPWAAARQGVARGAHGSRAAPALAYQYAISAAVRAFYTAAARTCPKSTTAASVCRLAQGSKPLQLRKIVSHHVVLFAKRTPRQVRSALSE